MWAFSGARATPRAIGARHQERKEKKIKIKEKKDTKLNAFLIF